MQIGKDEWGSLAELIAKAVVNALKKENLIGNASASSNKKTEKSAYAKTESLLYNYRGFQKIVEEKLCEIEELRKYGVPKKGGAVVQYGGGSGTVQGIVLPEESVEKAVQRINASVQGTVDAIALIDRNMAALKNDPYYKALEMRYFDGRTLEDIGVYFGCDHSTVSRNKSRLVKELSLRLFPDDVINEYIG